MTRGAGRGGAEATARVVVQVALAVCNELDQEQVKVERNAESRSSLYGECQGAVTAWVWQCARLKSIPGKTETRSTQLNAHPLCSVMILMPNFLPSLQSGYSGEKQTHMRKLGPQMHCTCPGQIFSAQADGWK